MSWGQVALRVGVVVALIGLAVWAFGPVAAMVYCLGILLGLVMML